MDETEVTLEMILAAGIISPKEVIYGEVPNGPQGVVLTNGKLTVSVNGEERLFDFPSGAARAITGRSLNGWLYWHCFHSGKFVPLKALRSLFLWGEIR